MKKRDIILDFTSLLDVTLIIIFFFILFSHLDGVENKKRTDEKIQEMNAKIEAAEDREAYAEELITQKEKELAIVQNESKRRASEVEELIAYSNGQNIKIILDMGAGDWSIRVIQNKNTIANITKNDDIGSKLVQTMEETGYSPDHTIYCDFVFDGSIPGTKKAYSAIVTAMDEVKKKYDEFYYSETDMSIGKEDNSNE